MLSTYIAANLQILPLTPLTSMNRSRSIEGGASLLLDFLRLTAALVVVIWHAKDMWYPATAHDPSSAGNPAHSAVVVFFVLSGFVIAFTTSARNRTLSQYLEARLGRLCSMVLPALLLTAVIEVVVRTDADPALLAEYVRGAFLPRYLISGAFMNELWLFSAAPPVNRALWSLSFEFWYYVIFGLWFCTGRTKKSVGYAAIACLIAGPKILLLMPIWIMGCAAYWLPRPKVGAKLSWLGVAAALAAAFWVGSSLRPLPFEIGHAPFYFANQFVTDWCIGLFVAIALWLIPAPSDGTKPSIHLVKRVRAFADLTFPIYVLHYPLLVLYRVVFDTRFEDPIQYGLAVLTVVLISASLGLLLESWRPFWSAQFRRLFTLFKEKGPIQLPGEALLQEGAKLP